MFALNDGGEVPPNPGARRAPLKTTPFHARTSALMEGQAWRRWAGFIVASTYELAPDREILAIRSASALIDISPLYKYEISGADAGAFLDHLVTRDVSKMAVGQLLYTPWCNSRGKIIDDGTIARLSDHVYRLTAAESNARWLDLVASDFDVTISDVSEDLAALAVQGPTSRALLEHLTGRDLRPLAYHSFTEAPIAGHTTMISRTGYTGDLGYEIWIPKPRALGAWDAIREAGGKYGLHPAGIWAMDVARIEAGLVMLDVDYTPAPRAFTEAQASSPFELGLGWAVHLNKARFVGKTALRAEKARGAALRLVGLTIDHRAFEQAHTKLGLTTPYPFIPWREIKPIWAGDPAEHGGTQVGYATCGTWSPALKKYIALAQVAPAHAAEGQSLFIDLPVDRGRPRFRATVTKLPFLNLERKRA